MRYLTKMAADIRFWHPSALPSDVEFAFGKNADRKSAVGENRDHGDRSPHRRTYCGFVVSEPQETDFEELAANCLSVVNQNWDAVGSLIQTGGTMVFTIQVFGDTWIQMNVGRECLAALARAKAEIAIEHHDQAP